MGLFNFIGELYESLDFAWFFSKQKAKANGAGSSSVAKVPLIVTELETLPDFRVDRVVHNRQSTRALLDGFPLVSRSSQFDTWIPVT